MDPPCGEVSNAQQLVEEASHLDGGRTDQVGEQEEEGGHDSCLVERCWAGRKEDEGGGQGSSYIKTFLWC